VIALTSPERRYDGVFLSNYALLNLYDALGRVPGVGQSAIFGARDYSMRIWLGPDAWPGSAVRPLTSATSYASRTS